MICLISYLIIPLMTHKDEAGLVYFIPNNLIKEYN